MYQSLYTIRAVHDAIVTGMPFFDHSCALIARLVLGRGGRGIADVTRNK